MKGIVVFIFVILVAFFIYAYGRRKEADKARRPGPPPKVVQEVGGAVDYAIGGAQVHAGKKAMDKAKRLTQPKPMPEGE